MGCRTQWHDRTSPRTRIGDEKEINRETQNSTCLFQECFERVVEALLQHALLLLGLKLVGIVQIVSLA